VLSVIDKPELDNWRVSQAIHSALTLPRLPDEGEDAFADRVLADAEAQANKAAEFGTRIHDAIAAYMIADMKGGTHQTMDHALLPYLEPFYAWAMENIEQVHGVEVCVGHPSIGVAGRMDLRCTLKGLGMAVVDFKSQNIKNEKPSFWGDWPIQLACYRRLDGYGSKSECRIVSMVIPSNEPGPVHVNVWDESRVNYMDLFNAALEIWIYTRGNGYDPRH